PCKNLQSVTRAAAWANGKELPTFFYSLELGTEIKYRSFCNPLSSANCRDRLSSDDADSSYNLLVSVYASASCLAIPTRVRKTQLCSNPKWFNQSIEALTREKYKFHCLCRSAPHNADLKAAYIQSCKKVKTAVRKAICKFEAFIMRSCKLQPKLLFNYINSQKACNDSIKGLLDADGCFQTDGRVIARLLNEHFSSVFSLRDYESVPAMPCRSNTKCVVNLDVFSPD
ncbi:RNA-directed DNA polymerase from mobile element jockey-like, partial [Brachionus plicatilis]